jgi:hypothetical protein
MEQQSSFGLDKINKIYRIEGQDAGLSFCIRPASTPHFRPICKYPAIISSKMKFSQGLALRFLVLFENIFHVRNDLGTGFHLHVNLAPVDRTEAVAIALRKHLLKP